MSKERYRQLPFLKDFHLRLLPNVMFNLKNKQRRKTHTQKGSRKSNQGGTTQTAQKSKKEPLAHNRDSNRVLKATGGQREVYPTGLESGIAEIFQKILGRTHNELFEEIENGKENNPLEAGMSDFAAKNEPEIVFDFFGGNEEVKEPKSALIAKNNSPSIQGDNQEADLGSEPEERPKTLGREIMAKNPLQEQEQQPRPTSVSSEHQSLPGSKKSSKIMKKKSKFFKKKRMLISGPQRRIGVKNWGRMSSRPRQSLPSRK